MGHRLDEEAAAEVQAADEDGARQHNRQHHTQQDQQGGVNLHDGYAALHQSTLVYEAVLSAMLLK